MRLRNRVAGSLRRAFPLLAFLTVFVIGAQEPVSVVEVTRKP